MDFLVVEDDPILRDFLVSEVSSTATASSSVVRSASCVHEANALISQIVPDALVLDLNLPDGSGMSVAEYYSATASAPRILILTGLIDQFTLPPAVQPYVHAVLSKTDGLAPLRTSLWQLISDLSDHLPDLSKLSPRQLEVLRLLGTGLDTAEVAEYLGITFATAQTHRRQITSRLGIRGSRLLCLAQSLPPADA